MLIVSEASEGRANIEIEEEEQIEEVNKEQNVESKGEKKESTGGGTGILKQAHVDVPLTI